MKKLLIVLIYIFSVNHAYGYVNANQFMRLCKEEESLCDMYYAGYLDGLMNGLTTAEWNWPKNQSISLTTIKNVFTKFLNDHPVQGETQIGAAVTISLMQAGVLKTK